MTVKCDSKILTSCRRILHPLQNSSATAVCRPVHALLIIHSRVLLQVGLGMSAGVSFYLSASLSIIARLSVLFRLKFLLDVGCKSYCDTLFLVRPPFQFVILTSPYGHVASSELSGQSRSSCPSASRLWYVATPNHPCELNIIQDSLFR